MFDMKIDFSFTYLNLNFIMYNSGDEIGAVVGDIGSLCSKIGFAGEDFPRAYFSSSVGLTSDENDALNESGNEASRSYKHHVDATWQRTDIDLHWPVKAKGAISDWDMIESIWNHAIHSKLMANLSETPILLCEKSSAAGSVRHKYAELMFEKFAVPAMFYGRDAVLSCFAVGKTTGTAIDIGAQTTISPVTDGWVDQSAIVTSPLGSTVMHKYCNILLREQGLNLLPHQAFRMGCRPSKYTDESSWFPSYREFLQLELARDIIETAGRVSEIAVDNQAPQFTSVPGVPYKLPDGTEVVIGVERFNVPELFFNTDPLVNIKDGSALKELVKSMNQPSIKPLQQLIIDCIHGCEREVHSQLASALVLSGGGAGFQGMPERLRLEMEFLSSTLAPSWRIKVLAAGANERSVAAWLGGSILASLGSFHEMWMSKSEYEEHGSRYVDKKFP